MIIIAQIELVTSARPALNLLRGAHGSRHETPRMMMMIRIMMMMRGRSPPEVASKVRSLGLDVARVRTHTENNKRRFFFFLFLFAFLKVRAEAPKVRDDKSSYRRGCAGWAQFVPRLKSSQL